MTLKKKLHKLYKCVVSVSSLTANLVSMKIQQTCLIYFLFDMRDLTYVFFISLI